MISLPPKPKKPSKTLDETLDQLHSQGSDRPRPLADELREPHDEEDDE